MILLNSQIFSLSMPPSKRLRLVRQEKGSPLSHRKSSASPISQSEPPPRSAPFLATSRKLLRLPSASLNREHNRQSSEPHKQSRQGNRFVPYPRTSRKPRSQSQKLRSQVINN